MIVDRRTPCGREGIAPRGGRPVAAALARRCGAGRTAAVRRTTALPTTTRGNWRTTSSVRIIMSLDASTKKRRDGQQIIGNIMMMAGSFHTSRMVSLLNTSTERGDGRIIGNIMMMPVSSRLSGITGQGRLLPNSLNICTKRGEHVGGSAILRSQTASIRCGWLGCDVGPASSGSALELSHRSVASGRS